MKKGHVPSDNKIISANFHCQTFAPNQYQIKLPLCSMHTPVVSTAAAIMRCTITLERHTIAPLRLVALQAVWPSVCLY